MQTRTAWMLGGAGAGLAGAAALMRMRSMADLTGNIAVITGSSRGLGLLLAREFARQQCQVVLCARDEAELERARQSIETEGGRAIAVRADVTSEEDVANLIRETRQRFGRVDILVNNAGTIQVGPVETMTASDFEEAMKVIFWGMLNPTLAVMPEMIARRSGRIVNITSIGGKIAVPHLLPYTCAKFAAVGLSEGLRPELRRHGVVVTTVVPGLMRTGSFLNASFKGRQDEEYRWFALGATLPGVSMDAERAARQIVRATRRGDSERILSIPASLLARIHGLAPGLTADVLGLVNRMALPDALGGRREAVRGADIKRRSGSAVLNAVMKMGFSAAQRFNQSAA